MKEIIYLVAAIAAAAAGITQLNAGMTEEQVFEQFLANQRPAFFSMDGESGTYYEDYCSGGFLEEEEYEVSRLDLDNDGRDLLLYLYRQ